MQLYKNGLKFSRILVCTLIFNYFLESVLCCPQQFLTSECSAPAVFRQEGKEGYTRRRHGSKYHYQYQDIYSLKPLMEEKQKLQQVATSETFFSNCTTRETRKANEWSLSNDGFLKVIANNVHEFHPPGSFCLNSKLGLAFICLSPEDQIFLWKKCCREDELLHLRSNTCVKKNISYYRPRLNQTIKIVREAIPKCSPGTKLQRYSIDNCESSSTSAKTFNRFLMENSVETEYDCRFRVKSDDEIEYESSEGLFLRKNTWRKLPPRRDYCLDGTYEDPSTSCESTDLYLSDSNMERCDADRIHGVLLFCDNVGVSQENSNRSKSISLAAVWLSTCPLLLVAAVVNFLFVQKNVHGWTLTAYLISMFLVNITSVVLVLEKKSEGCRVVDFFMKFIYFSTLCWMTSINFSLWRTFRRASPKKTSPKRFLFYLIFCTSFPAVVVTLSYFMGRKNPCEDPKKQVQCALYNYETLPYYSGPVIGMILLNLTLFLRTTYRIMGLRNETSAVLHKTNKDNLESFRLFTKLFLMTGSIWVIRVILLVLQIKGLYFTWYGVVLEIAFSIPEAVFPIILILHPEFIKWLWLNYPRIAKMVQAVIPCFRVRKIEVGTVFLTFNNGTITPSS